MGSLLERIVSMGDGGVDQTPFFEGLGFKRCEYKWGDYHLAPSGSCYRIDHFSHCYVIEDADNQDEAERNLFEDADLFDDSKPWESIVREIRLRLMEYEREVTEVADKHMCPVCGQTEFEMHGSYDICEVCGWEDDPLEGNRPDYGGGANGITLTEARERYKKYGSIFEP